MRAPVDIARAADQLDRDLARLAHADDLVAAPRDRPGWEDIRAIVRAERELARMVAELARLTDTQQRGRV